MNDPNPWHPIKDAVDLKHLGKLCEELNECGAAVSRCIIQGMDERNPHGGQVNWEWLQDEIADVYANIALVTEHFGLDQVAIEERIERKMDHLRKWHTMA